MSIKYAAKSFATDEAYQRHYCDNHEFAKRLFLAKVF